MTISRFFTAASAGAIFGFWVALMVLAFGDGGIRLDGTQQGQFVLGYFLMIYGPPLAVAILTYLSFHKAKPL